MNSGMVASTEDALELIDSIKGLQISTHINIACFGLLIYDYLLTFEDERTLIWQSEWSFPKVVFLITRYFPVIDLSMTISYYFKSLTPDECYRKYKAMGHLINAGICIAELIPIIRTWAIWERSRTITIVLFIWATINLGVDVVIITVHFNAARLTPLPRGVPGCLFNSDNSLLVGAWIILMVFEAGILGMTALQGIQLYRVYENKQLRNSALFKAFFTNGAIFYVYVFGGQVGRINSELLSYTLGSALSVANVIVITSFPRDYVGLLASVERVAHAVLMERLVITLCKAARPEPEEEDLTKLDTMQFEQNQGRVIDTEAETRAIVSPLGGNRTCPGPSTPTAFGKEPVKNERSSGCDA